MLRAIRFFHSLFKRFKKICRSYYYFGRGDIYVHGPIYVGIKRNVKIGEKCSVNRGVHIMGFNEVSLGKYVILSTNCMLLDSNLDHEHLIISDKRIHIPNHIRIDDYVWVGAGSIILPGVTIGQRSIIAAGSVVNKSFPEDVLVGGNPAKIIRKLR